MFKHFLHLSTTMVVIAITLAFTTMPASAYQTSTHFNQAEQRDGYGRITVEAATIYVLNCNGAGENGRQIYIYQYLKRPGFRAVLPGYWHAIGGQDFGTFGQAAGTGCATR
jgi:N-dimethylarginine dimethylaminohydrolase